MAYRGALYIRIGLLRSDYLSVRPEDDRMCCSSEFSAWVLVCGFAEGVDLRSRQRLPIRFRRLRRCMGFAGDQRPAAHAALKLSPARGTAASPSPGRPLCALQP